MESSNGTIASSIKHWLAHDYAAIDPELASAIQRLARRNAAISWHKHGTFLDHLIGVYRILRLWGEPRASCLCGLFHSVYANEYVDLALFDVRTERPVLIEWLGEEIEGLVHDFCMFPRTTFTQRVIDDPSALSAGMRIVDERGNAEWNLSAATVRVFLAVTIADLAEQWFRWQDQVLAGYPYLATPSGSAAQAWRQALWPGSLQPSFANMSLLSRLARRLSDAPGTVPPIFDRCARLLAHDDDAAATARYWDVAVGGATGDVAPPNAIDRAAQMLSEALAHNPWFAEPCLQLAHIELLRGDFDAAGALARRGLNLLIEWGTPQDKRISWEGWTTWACVLARGAERRRWPSTLRAHNNLGLVEDIDSFAKPLGVAIQ